MKKNDVRLALRMLLWFARIGCFTFGGGWALLAQMEQEFVEKRQLITKDELLDLVAVGKSLPGIMIANISMLFGYQMAGVVGGLCAVVGIAFPAVIILSIVALCYNHLRDNRWFAAALQGVGCAVVPIIGGAALSMGQSIFRTKAGCTICIIAALLCVFTNVGNITMVAIGAVAGLIWMAADRKKGADGNGAA